MKIRVRYGFYTDGDYSLRNPENFGCTGREVEIEDEYFDYVGSMDFESDDTWECKYNAKTFLEELLCDGIHISSSHYWLMQDFYNIFETLMEFINEDDTGVRCKWLSGNYDRTYISVEFI